MLAPREIVEIETRLRRLGEWMANDNSGLTADELQAAIERAKQEKRCNLANAQPTVKR